MGGGTISIEGVGFAEIPSDNLVRFEVDNANIDGYAVGDILSGPPLLESDEGESSTSAGVLVYTVPGIEELTGRPLDTFTSAFDGSIVLSLQISVLNTDTDEVMECTHGHTCDVKFRYDYTPQLHDIIPNNAWAGAEVVLMMDPAFTRYQITAEEGPYESIKVGHAHTNYEGLMESTYRGHNLQPNRYPIYLGSET